MKLNVKAFLALVGGITLFAGRAAQIGSVTPWGSQVGRMRKGEPKRPTKTKSRILFIALALLLPLVARAQFTFTTNSGAITIAGYTGTGGAVVIPATINGYPVVSIRASAFFLKTNVTSVSIPDSVTSIGAQAFERCSSLTNFAVSAGNPTYSTANAVLFNKVQSTLILFPVGIGGAYTIPPSVTSIGDYSFSTCTGLTNVTIPNSVTSIRKSAFRSCSGLKSVTIPNSVTSIEQIAFWFCTGLTNVAIPDSVTSIGGQAFENCAGLKSVTIGNGVTSIADHAFNLCTNLTNINVSASNPAYSSANGVLFDKAQTTLTLYPGGVSGAYTIPSSVTSIGSVAFENCSGLTSVTIPNSVTSIGAFVFVGCTSLTSINVSASNPFYSSASGVLFDKAQTALILFPEGVGGIYTVPNSVTSIEVFAFLDCTGLTSVTIGNSVTSIGSVAFENCTGLTSVTVPNNVNSIGSQAFAMGVRQNSSNGVFRLAFGEGYA